MGAKHSAVPSVGAALFPSSVFCGLAGNFRMRLAKGFFLPLIAVEMYSKFCCPASGRLPAGFRPGSAQGSPRCLLLRRKKKQEEEEKKKKKKENKEQEAEVVYKKEKRKEKKKKK